MGFPFDFLSGQSADQEYPKNTYPKRDIITAWLSLEPREINI